MSSTLLTEKKAAKWDSLMKWIKESSETYDSDCDNGRDVDTIWDKLDSLDYQELNSKDLKIEVLDKELDKLEKPKNKKKTKTMFIDEGKETVFKFELPTILVKEEKYNLWVNNCKKNKSGSSWCYLTNQNNGRRKVRLYNDELIYHNDGQWGLFKVKELEEYEINVGVEGEEILLVKKKIYQSVDEACEAGFWFDGMTGQWLWEGEGSQPPLEDFPEPELIRT